MGDTLLHGECVEEMGKLDPDSIDALVTDPPYGLEFMGKDWDRLAGTPGYNERGRITHRPDAQVPYGRGGGVNSYQAGRPMQEWHYAWAVEALRVLKPGGHLVAFGGTRTYHRLVCALEDAGWEIRDCLMWLYGQGFPKSKNVGGGWGTALKPAWEPIILARRPLAGTVAGNIEKHGVGALNIDGCRLGDASDVPSVSATRRSDYPNSYKGDGPGWGRTRGGNAGDKVEWSPTGGRWPANVVLSHTEECREVGTRKVKTGTAVQRHGGGQRIGNTVYSGHDGNLVRPDHGYADPDGTETIPAWECAPDCPVRLLDEQSGERPPSFRNSRTTDPVGSTWALGRTDGASFGHCDSGGASRFFYTAKADSGERHYAGKNTHPTVKPVDLMRWLCRLVTPKGGLVLDPFMGSGSTGVAAMAEGFRFIGIEREAEYIAIARKRIAGPLFAGL